MSDEKFKAKLLLQARAQSHNLETPHINQA